MRSVRITRIARWVTVGGLALVAAAGATSATEPEQSPTLALQPATREALIEEMRSIQQASHEIFDALVAGDHATVRQRAVHIQESFILESALSEEQKAELHEKLPHAFVAMDGAFHQTAQRLAEAARRADGELELFYFGKLTSACTACHSKFATHRFPRFQDAGPEAPAHRSGSEKHH